MHNYDSPLPHNSAQGATTLTILHTHTALGRLGYTLYDDGGSIQWHCAARRRARALGVAATSMPWSLLLP
eukprot:2523482-Prymnesium_polylepis.1